MLAELLVELSKAALEHVYFRIEQLRPAAIVASPVGLAHGLVQVRPAALRKLAVKDKQVLSYLISHTLNVFEEVIGDELLQGHVLGAREVSAVVLVWEAAVDDVQLEW